jgi:peptidylprolyl isomerase
MKKNILLNLILLVSLLFFACSTAMKEDGIYAVIKTSMGDMICKLFYDKAPVTVSNYILLAEGKMEYTDYKTNKKIKDKFYDGLTFHRIVKDFVIQGGCPKGDGTGSPGYDFVDEFDDTLKHDSIGILSMANSGPNTNGSQFFITLKPAPFLDGKHTIFGKIVGENSMKTLIKIGEVKVDENDKPYKDVYIKTIKIVRVGKDAKAFDPVKEFAKNEEKLKKYEENRKLKAQLFLKAIGVDESKLITTNSGLKYHIWKKGYGAKPKQGNIVVINAEGFLEEGIKFLSTYENNTPLEVSVGTGNLFPGLDEGILTMQEGEKRLFILPYYLAFGENGKPPIIPPKATILIDIELLKIKK